MWTKCEFAAVVLRSSFGAKLAQIVGSLDRKTLRFDNTIVDLSLQIFRICESNTCIFLHAEKGMFFRIAQAVLVSLNIQAAVKG